MDRRKFIKSAAAAGLGLSVAGGLAPAIHARSPNETVVVAVAGIRSRGSALAQSFANADNAEVGYVIDVDDRYIGQAISDVAEIQGSEPAAITDLREALDDNAVDALVIATPDHWHAPAALMGVKAGKHVYVEKPCGHNPREGELLVEAMRRYDPLIQMGNQQRSSPRSQQAVQEIRNGIIGRPYFARAWYANDRGPTYLEGPSEVPAHLDWELWQGPAPRVEYYDNVHPYNWHWFWHWGTAEICNNGTHEIDVCRWALDVDFPLRVSSTGGRYHYNDDWEAFDTQVAGFDFEGEKSITWEGRSCNANPIKGGEGMPGGGRGASIHGTEGTVIIDRNGYVVYDNDNELVKREMRGDQNSGLDTRGGGGLTDYHIANFVAAIREGEDLNSPIDEGHKSVLLCHLGNIAQRTGQSLHCNPENGRIVDNDEAMALWSREYADGWTPTV